MGDTKFRKTGHRTAQGPYRADERLRRQVEATERSDAWISLSTAEKLRSLRSRRGESKRQITRLETQS